MAAAARSKTLGTRALTVSVALGLALAAWASSRASSDEAPPAGSVTAGYAADRSCAICHSEIYRSYQDVGMARSFFRPSQEKVIEDFDGEPYFHERSGRYYEMRRRDGRFFFKRYQRGPDGEPINVFEQEIDWVLGSGNKSRTYLFRTESGELYQLPVAWYTESSSWGMAPGFDSPSPMGVARRVPRECMFCHNAYPDVPRGSDAHFEHPTYPAELPQGTGCQRCHGPAAEHVRTATESLGDKALVRATIVNPARLPPRLRDDVCDQCHLQPSVALFGVRRFGRGDYSYRPGEPLSEYMVEVDVDTEGEERSERFEINHHPYRLRQSRCFEESGRELSCLTCHDPHRKVPEEERAAHYRKACLTCHQVDQCGLEAMTGEPATDADPGDCVACHMAQHRPQDVVQVVMTDHLIRRRPGGPELLAPREESVPVLVDVELTDEARAPEGALGEMYRAVAVQRAGGNASAIEHLGRMLEAVRPPEAEPYLDLGKGLLQLGRYEEAERTLRFVLERHGATARAEEWRGIALYRLGRVEEAIAALRRVVEKDPGRTADAWHNLGVTLKGAGREEEALACLEKAVAARPVMAPAWYQLGQVQLGLGRPDDAVASFQEALRVDPNHEASYLVLGDTLLARGRKEEALRYWRHGAKFASGTEAIAAALEAASE